MVAMGMTAAKVLGGVVVGGAIGDLLGAVPTKGNAPDTGSGISLKGSPSTGFNAVPQVTGDGTPVNPAPTAKESLWTSALIVVAAMAILLFGSRALKDARIS